MNCKRRRMRVNGVGLVSWFAIFALLIIALGWVVGGLQPQKRTVANIDVNRSKAAGPQLLATSSAVPQVQEQRLLDVTPKPVVQKKISTDAAINRTLGNHIKKKVNQPDIVTLNEKLTLVNEHLEEQHQKISQLSNHVTELRSNNEALVEDLAQRKNMIAAKDRQIAELSSQLDGLKEQVTTEALSNGHQTRSDESERDVVRQQIERWRVAWQSQDIDAYLSRYTSDFQPSNGRSHRAWRQDRQRKLTRPKTISVQIRGLRIQRLDGKRWQAVFEQAYKSNIYLGEVTKELVLIKVDDQYLIEKERNL